MDTSLAGYICKVAKTTNEAKKTLKVDLSMFQTVMDLSCLERENRL